MNEDVIKSEYDILEYLYIFPKILLTKNIDLINKTLTNAILICNNTALDKNIFDLAYDTHDIDIIKCFIDKNIHPRPHHINHAITHDLYDILKMLITKYQKSINVKQMLIAIDSGHIRMIKFIFNCIDINIMNASMLDELYTVTIRTADMNVIKTVFELYQNKKTKFSLNIMEITLDAYTYTYNADIVKYVYEYFNETFTTNTNECIDIIEYALKNKYIDFDIIKYLIEYFKRHTNIIFNTQYDKFIIFHRQEIQILKYFVETLDVTLDANDLNLVISNDNIEFMLYVAKNMNIILSSKHLNEALEEKSLNIVTYLLNNNINLNAQSYYHAIRSQSANIVKFVAVNYVNSPTIQDIVMAIDHAYSSPDQCINIIAIADIENITKNDHDILINNVTKICNNQSYTYRMTALEYILPNILKKQHLTNYSTQIKEFDTIVSENKIKIKPVIIDKFITCTNLPSVLIDVIFEYYIYYFNWKSYL
jgi:hypothetical protein